MNLEKNDEINQKSNINKFLQAWALSLALLFSNQADAGWFSDHVKIKYNAEYYEKYNDKTPNLETSHFQSTKFNVNSGILHADGNKLVLVDSENTHLSQDALKEFDLQQVVVQIDWKYYKAKPSFKTLYFQKSWNKHGFGYQVWKKITLVYVPYDGKIVLFGSISAGQYIEENDKKIYNISSFETNKKQILNRTLQLLWAKNVRWRDIQADGNHNNYFYHNWRFVWVLQNFGNEKVLIRWKGANSTIVAKLLILNWNFLMTSPSWKVLYQAHWSNVWISLDTLDYYLDLNLSE